MIEARQSKLHCATVIVCLLALPACKRDGGDEDNTAIATLTDAQGEQVGTATLTEGPGGVDVEFNGYSLPPGTHGFHIHEHGRCDAPSFESAGGHFNPTNVGHGLEDADGAHVGDLPNLEVGGDGTAEFRGFATGATLEKSGDMSLIAGEGTALVIHRDADDQRTDPAGNAGPRIACGVIKLR